MSPGRRKRGVLLFCFKFLVLVSVFSVVWWWLLPYHGWVLMQLSGGILRNLLGVPIDYGRIEAAGILNTQSLLRFGIGQEEPAMPIALLVTNVPPYLALVLATAGIALRRRIRILALGTGILMAGHVLFIVLALQLRLAGATGGAVGELPTALAQFYLTLPFLLWLAFAYWDQIAQYIGEEAPGDGEDGTLRK